MRDADVQLYDAACELLVAAQGLHERAVAAGAAAAIAPALGCLQEALSETELAMQTLVTKPRTGDASSAHRLRAALDDLAAMLRLAQHAAEAARAAAAQAADARAAGSAEASGRRADPRASQSVVCTDDHRPG